MPTRVLISYRRDDTAGHAGRIYDRLAMALGTTSVFMDTEAIGPGRDFTREILNAVESCEVLIAIIGKDWLDVSDQGGERRLDAPGDWVRLEIATALQRDVVVIPVLVDGASMPRERDLPPELLALATRQAIEVSDTRFSGDIERLLASVRAATTPSQPAPTAVRRRAVAVWGAAFAAVFATIVGLVVSMRSEVSTVGTNMPPPQTGWIFHGYYDLARQVYIEGPYASVAFRPTGAERGLLVPALGDVMRVTKDRRVIIANYRDEGLRNQMTSPPLIHGTLSEVDETGVTHPRGAFVIVRDVEVSGYPDRPASVWLRVAPCDSQTAACQKASDEAKDR